MMHDWANDPIVQDAYFTFKRVDEKTIHIQIFSERHRPVGDALILETIDDLPEALGDHFLDFEDFMDDIGFYRQSSDTDDAWQRVKEEVVFAIEYRLWEKFKEFNRAEEIEARRENGGLGRVFI